MVSHTGRTCLDILNQYAPAGSSHCNVNLATYLVVCCALGELGGCYISARVHTYRQRPVWRAGGKHAQALAAQSWDPDPTLAAGAAAEVSVGVEQVNDPDIGEALQALQAVLWNVAPAQQLRWLLQLQITSRG